ncbi:MAG: Calx-beta domain-containing protein, partial [Planctomycetaceae bacterium]
PFTFTASMTQYDVATMRWIAATSNVDITVVYSTEDITAQGGTDYVPVVGGTFTIPAGQSTATFTINVIGDAVVEADETFRVNFTGVTGGDAWLNPTSIIGTILNDDPTPLKPAVTFAAKYGTPGNYAATVAEGDPPAVYSTQWLDVTLDGGGGAPALRPAVVSYRVIPATGPNAAKPQADFIPQTGTITIPAGQTAGRIPVRIVNDVWKESDETFLVEITSVTPGVMKLGQTCVVTITDSDTVVPAVPNPPTALEPVTLVGPVQVGEGDGTANFTVNLNPGVTLTTPVRVVYQLVNGTAVSGSDFLGTLGQVTIPAGQSFASISVPIVDDRLVESTENFTIRINSVTGATTNGPQSIAVDIFDNDGQANANVSLLAAFAAYGASSSQSTTTTTKARTPGV